MGGPGDAAHGDAARQAEVGHFIYVSYTGSVDTDDPLTEAKRAVEQRLRDSGMTYTILRPSYFIEMWLGPALGFDLAGGTARVLGSGDQRVNWISAQDVVVAVVACVDNPQAHGAFASAGHVAVPAFRDTWGQPHSGEARLRFESRPDQLTTTL